MNPTRQEIDIEEHLGLVHHCANRFRGRGMEYEELYSAGCMGLVKAAHAFDTSRGVCFSTYAVPVIIGEIKRLFRDNGSVKVGRRLKERALQASRICEQLRQQYGQEPTVQQIAEALGISEAEAAEALCAAQPTVPLTAYTEDGELERDLPTASPDIALQEHMALQQVLALLTEKDRRLIHLRYEESLTQTETAKRLGMTQVQVSRREKKILLFLREELLR